MVLQQASLLGHVVRRAPAAAAAGAEQTRMGGDERHGLPPDAAARHGTPRWAPLTADEEQEYETNLHRWNAEALATEVKQAEMELPPLFYCHGSAGGITLEEKEDQLTLSRAMAENPHLLRRELALRRVTRYRFAPTEPRQDAAGAWRQAEAIDRVMELVVGGLRPEDAGRAARVSRRWREAAAAEHAWKEICAREYPALVPAQAKLGGRWRQLVTDRARGEKRRPEPPAPQLSDFMIGVEITDSAGGSMSFVEELKDDSCFVDHRPEGAQEQQSSGHPGWGQEPEDPYCEEAFAISAFLVRKADRKVISLGDSKKDLVDYVRYEKWNTLGLHVPELVVEPYEPGSSGGRTVIEATFYSESVKECQEVEVTTFEGIVKKTKKIYEDMVLHKATGVKLTMVESEEWEEPNRNVSVFQLLKQIQKQHPLRPVTTTR